MKILVITSSSKSLVNFRGALLKELREMGHEIYTLSPSYKKEVEKTLEEWGICRETYKLERTGVNLLQDIHSYYSLKRIIKSIRPQIVFSYTIKPVIYGSMAASNIGTNQVFAMITGLGSVFYGNKNLKGKALALITKYLYRRALKNTNGVIFQNPDDQRLFINNKIVQADKSHRVFGSGVDIDAFPFCPPQVNPIRFLFIGRLIRKKGLMEYLEACRQIKKRYPNIEFGLLGGTDSNPDSINEGELKQLKEENIVQVFGKTDDVRPYIREASVFVLPSYYGEGTPRTALESMSMGRPLIVADSPGCRETIRDGKNGYLVPVKNSEAIVSAMEKFIQHPNRIIKMGKYSRQMAEELYDVKKVNSSIIDILGL